MNYIKEEIKDGVNLHLIINDNFKTDFTVVFLSLPLEKETVAKNALIPAILKSGCNKYKNYKKIVEELEMMYGAEFACGIDKDGDNIVLKFFIESINDKYLPKQNHNLSKSIEILTEIILNPLIDKNGFKNEYIELEKKNLELLINSQKDEKDSYALERCINIMYKDCGYGLSKYGQIEDLKKITNENLYDHYKNIINTSKIDIFISGNFEKDKIISEVKSNKLINNLKPRKEKININHYKNQIKEKLDKPAEVKEKMEITQGKLVIGLDILPNDMGDYRFAAIIYNSIFGDGVNSKLFQIVREKESLAYTARSNYISQKNNIFIRCGIEFEKYDKTLKLIEELLKEMREGNFTGEDIKKAKEYIQAGINGIEAEQDTQIIYLFGQELSKLPLSIEEYQRNIEKVTKEEIIKLAKSIQINTIYFLENGGKNANN